jgi:hypothetical protein
MMALTLLGVVGSTAIILWAGASILRLLARAQMSEIPALERYGLWFLLGSGYVTVTIALAGFAVYRIGLVTLICAGALALHFFSRRVSVTSERHVADALSPVEWLLAAILLSELVFIVWWAPQVALGWDGLVLWEGKARVAFQQGGALPIRYLAEPPFACAQPLYPLYLPYLQEWLYLWLGRADQSWSRVYGSLTYFAGILIIAGSAQRLGVSRLAGLAAAAAFFFVPYCFTGQWNVLSGYADFPLGVFYLAAASRLPSLVRNPSRADLKIFAVCSGLVCWVKQEGVYLWLILLGIAGLILLRQMRWKAALALAIPGLLIGGGFKLFLKMIGAPSDPYYHKPSLENLRLFSGRIIPVLRSILSELFNLESWGLLWVGAFLALAIMLLRRNWSRAFPLGLAIILPLIFFIWPFVFSALESYTLHMEHARARLVLQVAPTAMLAIALSPPRSLFRSPRHITW